jgi:two-component system OmpR family response regulator
MSKLKILIVDDEEELVFTLSERLQFRDFDADAAVNSGDALKLVQEKKYDVAIIDLKMPVVGGMELMKMITPHQS